MLRLGILTVHQGKTCFLKKIKNPVQVKEIFRTQAEFVVAELAWNEKELRRLPRWVCRRIYQRGRNFLLKNSCIRIAPDRLAEDALFRSAREASGVCLPISSVMIKECMSDLLPDYSGKVFVKMKALQMADEELLAFLCPGRGSLLLCTDDVDEADVLAEKICNEYGFYPEIRKRDSFIPMRGLWIDLDIGAIGIGRDIIADGMEYAFDLQGYQVAQDHYWSDVPLPVSLLKFVSWCRGKKRLTSG